MKLIFLLIAMFLSSNVAESWRQTNEKIRGESFFRRMGTKLANLIEKRLPIKYEQFKKKESVVSRFLDNDDDITNCDSLRDINEYFFEIYSDTTGNITKRELDDMIKFQLKRFSKDKARNERRRNKKCARDKCILSKELLNISGLQYVDRESFGTVCPIMLYNLELENCDARENELILSRTTGNCLSI